MIAVAIALTSSMLASDYGSAADYGEVFSIEQNDVIIEYEIEEISPDSEAVSISAVYDLYADPGTSISIPNTVEYEDTTYEVVSIGSYAFQYCESISSISIPDTVHSIWYGAFQYCTALESISLPGNLDGIHDNVFNGCGQLASIDIPDTVTTIGDRAFYDCSCLSSIVLPASLESIGEGAFCGCASLASATLPDGLDSLGEEMFKGCTSLASINLPGSVTSIGNNAFQGCIELSSITLPGSVTSIGVNAFYGCGGLASIAIPGNVASIGWGAFSGCGNLESVIFDTVVVDSNECTSIATIVGDAFRGCTSLSSIVIPDSVTSIDYSAFRGCTSLASIEIPDSVTSIGENVFQECTSLASIEIPDSVTSIGENVFQECTSLASIEIPDSVTNIYSQAFYGCTGLETVTIGSGVTDIEGYAFYACHRLTGFSVDEGNGSYASVDGVLFDKAGTGLIQFPAGRSGAYTVPREVTSIEYYAFHNCGLNAINVAEGNTCYSSIDGVLFNYAGTELIQFPAGKDGAYTVPDSITTIGAYTFLECDLLTSVIIPDTVTEIGEIAFYGCSELETISIGSGLDTIGDYAFGGCVKHREFIVSDDNETFKSVDGVLFDKNVSRLILFPSANCTEYVVPDSVGTIGRSAFIECASIVSIDLSNVSLVEEEAFYCCINLATVIMPESGISVVDYAFVGCEMLSEIDLSNVVNFGYGSFGDCSSLSFADLSGAAYIDADAFSGCGNLKHLVFGDDLDHLDDYAFDYDIHWSLPEQADRLAFTLDPVSEKYVFGYIVSIHSSENETPVSTIVVANGGTIPVPTLPLAEGRVLEGWYSDGTFDTPWDIGNDPVTRAMSVHANICWDLVPCDASIDGEYTYTGGEQTPVITVDHDSQNPVLGTDYTYSVLGIEEDAAVCDAGTYTVRITGIGGWAGSKDVTWIIDPKPIREGDVSFAEPTYDGTLKNASVEVFGGDAEPGVDYTITGDTTGTDAGDYGFTVSAIPNGNYSGTVELTWTISRIAYPVPVAAGGPYVYTGSEQAFQLDGVVGGRMSVTGDIGTDADTYDVVVSLTDEDNCEWSDGTQDPKTIRFEIARKALSDSSIAIGSVVFNGSPQSPAVAIDGGNAKIGSDYVIGGANSGTDVCEYTLTISAEEDGNYTGVVERKWSISKLRLDYPVGDDTVFTYNGSDQTYVLEGFDSRWMAKSGDVRRNAGDYDVVVSIIDEDNCIWSDGKVDDKTYDFNIGKRALIISVSNIDVPYGTVSPEYLASGDGFAAGDGISGLGGNPEFSSGHQPTDPVGTKHDISVGGYASNDYIISYSPEKGVLRVVPLEITVRIYGAVMYETVSGSPHSAEGFTAESSSPLYDAEKVTYLGTAAATGVEEGTYYMNLDREKFRGNDPNFDIVFVIERDGALVISAHVHDWSSEYSSDGTHHWFVCGECDEKKDVTAHAYGEWSSVDGSRHRRVCVCGHEEFQNHSFSHECSSGEKHTSSCSCGYSFEADHVWDEGEVTTAPTHLAFGERTFSCTADGCTGTKTEQIPKTAEHSFGAWASVDGERHRRVCACGEAEYGDHVWNAGEVTTAPTHLAFGERTFSCTADGCTATRTEQIPKIAEHSFGEWESFDGYKHKRECACGETEYQDHALSHEKTSDLKHTTSCSCGYHAEMDHAWDEGSVTTHATHLAFGVRTFSCTADGCTATRTEQIQKISEHSYGSWTSVDAGQHKKVCACGDEVFESHGWGEWTTTLEPTEESTGTKERICASCGHKDVATIPKVGHVHDWSSELTSNEGYHWYACSGCSERKDEAAHDHSPRQLDDTQHELVCECGHKVLQNHSFTYSSASAEKHRASCSCGFSAEMDHAWGEWSVTTQPTHVADGVKTCSCTADGCDAVKSESVPSTGHSFGGWMQFDESKHERECDCGEVEYEDHDWSGWIADGDGHTRSCGCGESSHQDHAYGDWIVDAVAGLGQTGARHRECSVCEHASSEVIPAIVPDIALLDDRSVVSMDVDMDGGVDIRSILATLLDKSVEVVVSDKGSIIFNADAVSQLVEGEVVLSVREIDSGGYEDARLVLEIEVNGAGVTFTGDGKAKVVYEFTEPTPDGKIAKVYYIDGDERIDMGAVFEDGKVSWETDHFSIYVVEFVDAIAADSGDSEGGSPVVWIVVGVVALIAAGGAVGFAVYRKKQA